MKRDFDFDTIETMNYEEAYIFYDWIGDIIGYKGKSLDLKVDLTLIEVVDIKTEAGIQSALEQIIKATEDISSIRNKWFLIFAVKDQKDRYLDEENFFRIAMEVDEGAEKVKRIIQNFLSYFRKHGNVDDQLFKNEDEYSILTAVRSLSLTDEKYLDIVLEYLSTILWDGGGFSCNPELLDEIISKWGTTEACIRFRIALNFIVSGSFSPGDDYFFHQLAVGGRLIQLD